MQHKKQDARIKVDIMTNKRIMAMDILESNPKKHTIRFLYEPKTKLYFVFIGHHNSSFYSKSYKAAENQFNRFVALS